MIDTDKYEGHQVSEFKTSVAGPRHSWVTHQHKHVGTWKGAKDAMFVNHATAALITDAPLLLAEIKRLRDAMEQAIGYVVGDYYVLKVLCKALGKQLNPIQELMGDDARGEEE